MNERTPACAAPLRAIETVAKLLVADAVHDLEQVGRLLLENVAELKVLARLASDDEASPDAPAGAPSVASSAELPTRRPRGLWATEACEAAVLAGLEAAGGRATVRDMLPFIAFPAHLSLASRPSSTRTCLERLTRQGRVTRERANGDQFVAYTYTLVVAPALKAVGGGAA